jgi:hypothetical protein
MKAVYIVMGLALASSVHAQIVECPKEYPAKGAQREPHVAIKPAPLDNASVHVDELFGAGLLQGRQTEGKGDIEYGFGPDERKWLVCQYGSLQWWRELPAGVTQCALRVGGKKRGEMTARLRCQ